LLGHIDLERDIIRNRDAGIVKGWRRQDQAVATVRWQPGRAQIEISRGFIIVPVDYKLVLGNAAIRFERVVNGIGVDLGGRRIIKKKKRGLIIVRALHSTVSVPGLKFVLAI
jgi:hypothetical protein